MHGARAVLSRVNNTKKLQNKWLIDLIERRGKNKACVALANKNACIIWTLMIKGTHYQATV